MMKLRSALLAGCLAASTAFGLSACSSLPDEVDRAQIDASSRAALNKLISETKKKQRGECGAAKVPAMLARIDAAFQEPPSKATRTPLKSSPSKQQAEDKDDHGEISKLILKII